MGVTAEYGPLVTFQVQSFDSNWDNGPNVWHKGDMLGDPRVNLSYAPGQPTTTPIFGWVTNGLIPVIDQVPSAVSTTNIANAAAATSGTALVLVSSSGGGITVGQTVYNPATGNTVTGLLGIDVAAARTATGVFTNGLPGITVASNNIMGVKIGDQVTLTSSGTLPTPFALLTTYYVASVSNGNFPATSAGGKLILAATLGGSPISATSAGSGTQTLNFVVPVAPFTPVGYGQQSPVMYGQSNILQGPVTAWNPAYSVSRCIVVTSNGDDTAGFYTVSGYDIYGYPMSQKLTGVSSTTATTTKAFKYISSVVPSGTINSTALSVGTTDIIGLPLRTDAFPYLDLWWGTAQPTLQVVDTAPNFLAADIATATQITGDVRGTMNIGALFATNGTRRLLMFWKPHVGNMASTAGILGMTQA